MPHPPKSVVRAFASINVAGVPGPTGYARAMRHARELHHRFASKGWIRLLPIICAVVDYRS